LGESNRHEKKEGETGMAVHSCPGNDDYSICRSEYRIYQSLRHPVLLFAVLLCTLVPGPAAAQTADDVEGPSQAATLRRGFRNLQLGLTFDAAQDVLRRDSAFNYRGPEDVSLRLSDSQNVIDSPGRGFVNRVLLQFFDGSLYIITLYLNSRRLDYFQLYNRLEGRYGMPAELDPEMARWQDETTRITLERPLRIQFLDRSTFRRVRQTGAIEEAVQTELREEFLDAF
jgi:hypothetical protein